MAGRFHRFFVLFAEVLWCFVRTQELCSCDSVGGCRGTRTLAPAREAMEQAEDPAVRSSSEEEMSPIFYYVGSAYMVQDGETHDGENLCDSRLFA